MQFSSASHFPTWNILVRMVVEFFESFAQMFPETLYKNAVAIGLNLIWMGQSLFPKD